MRLVKVESAWLPEPPTVAFEPIRRIGGASGWYFADWLWRLRGAIDLLIGGIGMRRGRSSPVDLAPGHTVDFWRVEAFEPNRLLRLVAEMKVPGRAWLQFEVDGDESGSNVKETAIFEPAGARGFLYWYSLYPVHALVFKGMLRGIVREARNGREGGRTAAVKRRGRV